MEILLIDNYDSFTYNLAHALKEIDQVNLQVIRNDEIHLTPIRFFDKIIISPGPGLPSQNGSIISIIQEYYNHKPILGVCLGLQAIYEAFGGRLGNLPRVYHGVSSWVEVVEPTDILFENIPEKFQAGRYHSWVCDPHFLPSKLHITAIDAEGSIMACRHDDYPLHGIQFHPESILTPYGKQILQNFILKT